MNYKSAYSFIIIVALSFTFSCSPKKEEEKNAENPPVMLDENLQQVVSIDTVKIDHVLNVLNLSGKVTVDQENVVEIFPMFGGNVTDVRVELGDYVKKGDVLTIIKSSEVADYDKQKKEAESKMLIAQKNLEVANSMNQSGLMSQRDILVAEKELENAKADWKKINEVFSIYNIGDNSQYTVKSPVSGFVVEKNINREMQIRSDNNTEIFTISGLEDVWVLANVYESDISKVSAGNKVHITTPAYPDMTFDGTIDKVYNMLDSENKTMTVRIKLHNEKYLLKPGMFVSVNVVYSSNIGDAPCIDEQALIFENGKQFVIVTDATHQLSLKEVEVLARFDGKAALRSGLKDGEHVIVKNALLVYNVLSKH